MPQELEGLAGPETNTMDWVVKMTSYLFIIFILLFTDFFLRLLFGIYLTFLLVFLFLVCKAGNIS